MPIQKKSGNLSYAPRIYIYESKYGYKSVNKKKVEKTK